MDETIKKSLTDWCISLKNKESRLQHDNKIKFWNSKRGNCLKKKYSKYKNIHNLIAEKNRNKWKNKKFKEETMKRIRESGRYDYENHGKKVKEFYANPKNKEKIKSAMNAKNRIEKISIASKLMWKNFKDNNRELYNKLTRNKKYKKYTLNGYKMNSIEYLIGKCLNELNIKWKYESFFRFKKCCYIPDFVLESNKIIIECYGDYWHANPSFYKKDQHLFKCKSVKDIWEHDFNKKQEFEKIGYKYLFFWENDIRNNIENIKQKIKELI